MSTDKRPNAKQAIDLLKIHQVRRENALLSKQIQDFRAVVAKLEDRYTESAEQTQIAHNLAVEAQESIENVFSKFRHLQDRAEAFIRSSLNDNDLISNLQSRIQGFDDVLKNSCRQIRERIEGLEEKLEQTSKSREVDSDTLRGLVVEVQKDLTIKADKCSLAVLEKRVEDLTARQLLLQRETLDKPTENTQPKKPFIQGISDSRKRCDGQMQSASTELTRNGERRNSTQHTETLQKRPRQTHLSCHTGRSNNEGQSESGNDTYIDENSGYISKTAFTERIICDIEKLASLKQDQICNLNHYFSQAWALVNSLQQKTERFFVCCFVDGLAGNQRRLACKHWLDLNGWTCENLRLFTSLSSHSTKTRKSCLSDSHVPDEALCRELGIETEAERSAGARVQEDFNRPNDQVKNPGPVAKPQEHDFPQIEGDSEKTGLHRYALRSKSRQESQGQMCEGIDIRTHGSSTNSQFEDQNRGPHKSLVVTLKTNLISSSLPERLDSETSTIMKDSHGITRVAGASRSNSSSALVEDYQHTEQTNLAFRDNEKRGDNHVLVSETPIEALLPNLIRPRLVNQKRPYDNDAEAASQDSICLPAIVRAREVNYQPGGLTHLKKRQKRSLPPPPEIPILSTSSDL